MMMMMMMFPNLFIGKPEGVRDCLVLNHSLDSLDISSNCNHGYNSSFIYSNHFGSVGRQILILDRKKMENIQLEIHCLFHGSDRGFKQSFHVDIFETIPFVLDGKPIRENVWEKTKRKLVQTLTNYYEPSFRVIGIDGNSFSGSRNHHSGNYGSVGRKNSGVGGTSSGDSYYLFLIYAMNEKGSSDRNESFTVLVSDDPDRYTAGDNVYNHLFYLESEEKRGAGNRIQSPSPISSSSSSSGGGKSSSSSTKSFPSSSSGSSQGETSFSLSLSFLYPSFCLFFPSCSVCRTSISFSSLPLLLSSWMLFQSPIITGSNLMISLPRTKHIDTVK